MSAFGTKKPGANAALQMTFPEVFASEYELAGDHEAYAKGPSLEVRDLPEGHDLQAQYHEQKRKDANHMAMAALQAARSSEQKMLSYHHNYNMPKPVLGQRRIAPATDGAAGFGGNLYVDTEMRGGGSMTGGVLRSAQGQRYGKQMLLNRIPQLNAIAAAKSEWLSSQPVSAPFLSVDDNQETQEQPVGDLIELNLAVQQLEDAINSGVGGISRFTLVDLSTVFKLLLRLASTSNREELDILDGKFRSMVEGPVQELQAQIDEGGEVDEITNEQAIQSVINYTKKMSDYTHQMLGVVNMSLKERQAFSKALVKKLGLTRPNISRAKLSEDQPVPPMIRPRLPAPGERPPEPAQEGDDDDDGDRPNRGRVVPGEDTEPEESEEGEEGGPDPYTLPSAASAETREAGPGGRKKPIGRSISGTNYNVKALKHYYKTLTGETATIHSRAGLLEAIYNERDDKGFNTAGLFNEIPVVVQHGRVTGDDPRGKPLYGSKAAEVAFHAGYPEYRENKTYPLRQLLKDVRDFVTAYEDQFMGAQQRPNLAEEAAPRPAAFSVRGEGRGYGRGYGVSPMTDEFNVPKTSAVEAQQKESLARAGVSNVYYDRDGRQTFGYRSGAYFGEELPSSGPENLETKRQFNDPKDTPMTAAHSREAPNPMFNDKSAQFSPEQLAALAAGPQSGQGRVRKPVGRKPKDFAKKLGFGMNGGMLDAADRRNLKNRRDRAAAALSAAKDEYDRSKDVGARDPGRVYYQDPGRRHDAAANAATQRLYDKMTLLSEEIASIDGRLKRGYGRAVGGIMRGQNLEKTGFPDAGKLTVENGFPARGGAHGGAEEPKLSLQGIYQMGRHFFNPIATVARDIENEKRKKQGKAPIERTWSEYFSGKGDPPTSKPKMRSLLNQIKKAHPDQAAKVDGFLDHLKGQGRMVGAGWFDSLKSFVSGFFGKKVAAAAAAPGESTHGKTGPAEQLSRIGINSKADFRKWAAKGGHPDKGGDTATFQKVSGLAGQLGWSGGKKLSVMGLLGRLAVKKVRSAIKGKGLSLRQKLAEPAVDEPKRPGYGRTLNPNVRPKAAKAVLPPGTPKHILPGRSLGGNHGLTKESLPDTREGYVALAEELRGQGHKIRVNSGSQLKSIRANFIKKLGL